MDWKAQWVWDAGDPNPWNYHLCARTTFDLARAPRGARLHITADTRYVVWVNGERLGEGPVRAWPGTWRYDTYDLSAHLRSGANVLAVLAVHYGVGTFQTLPTRAGLLAQVEWDGEARVVTGPDWRVLASPGHERATPRISCQQAWVEVYDAGAMDDAWLGPGFDDSRWAPATAIGPAGMAPWTHLTPREIPLLTQEPVYPVAVPEARRVRPAQACTVNLRRQLLPGYLEANPKAICGLVAFRLRNEQGGARRVAMRVPGLVNAFHRLRVNGADVEAARQPAPPWNGERRFAFDLQPGENLVVVDVSGHIHDWVTFFALEDDSEPAAAVPEPEAVVTCGPFGAPDDAGFQSVWNARTAGDLDSARAQGAGIAAAEVVANPFLPVAYAHRLPGAPRVEQAGALCAASADVATIAPEPDGAAAELMLEFGRMTVGTWEIEVDAPAGTTLDLVGFEAFQDGHRDHCWGMFNALGYRCREGWQTFRSVVRRGCRYLLLTARFPEGETRPLRVRTVRTLLNTYPVVERGRFRCSDDRLNAIWEMGRWTTRLCMEDTYVDCPTYEQTFWVGDSRNEGAVNHWVFGEYALSRRCLLLAGESLQRSPIVESQVPSAWEDLLTTWSFLWAMACEEYWQATGDRAFVEEVYPAIARQTDFLLSRRGADGLMRFPAWNILDWAPMDTPADGACTHLQAWFVMALERQARLAEVLGRRDDVPRLRAARSELTDALNAGLWDEGRQAYRDSLHADGTPSTVFSQGTNTTVLLAGCVPPERREAVRRLVTEAPEGIVPVGSPFFVFFSMEALARLHEYEAVLDLARQRWGFMLDHDATTCWEVFPGWEPGGRWTRSHCHAWSAGPTYFLSRYQLGVAPLEPGFARALIAPQPAGLAWARGRVPTPRGEVSVAWEIDGNRFVLDVRLPEGVAAEARLPERWSDQGVVLRGGARALTADTFALEAGAVVRIESRRG